MDLSSTQQSPSIFNLDVPIDTPKSPLAHHPNNHCFAQFCDSDLVLLKFFFIEIPTQ